MDDGPVDRLRAFLAARDACDYDDDEIDYIVGETAEDVARLLASDIRAILAHAAALPAWQPPPEAERREGYRCLGWCESQTGEHKWTTVEWSPSGAGTCYWWRGYLRVEPSAFLPMPPAPRAGG